MTEYLEKLAGQDASNSELLGEMAQLYKQRLWHQLTVKLEDLTRLPSMSKGDNLVQLYVNFVKKWEDKMNPLKLAEFIGNASHQLSGTQAMEFLDAAISKNTKEKSEGRILLNAHRAGLLLKENKQFECKNLLEDLKKNLDEIPGADPLVQSAYYQAALDYYKNAGPASEYYRSGLMYLAYTPNESLSAERQSAMAFEMALAALVGDDVYNFGELLQSPIFASLEKTGNKWLAELLTAFNRGDILAYNSIRQASAREFGAIPVLQSSEAKLKEKLTILALLDMVFARSAADRCVSFSDIAARCQLKVNEVEFAVMKALSLKLVKGSIDEVDNTVTVTWVQPRVLEKGQILSIRDRLAAWASTVNQTVEFMQKETAGLATV